MKIRCAASILVTTLAAQQTDYTIARAVRAAMDQYPATTAAVEQASAAAAAISLARTSYLPRADFIAQANRATRNNVFGMVLPQSALPAISGPVLGSNTSGSAWGSAVGFHVAWEPFDFGLRRANIETAEAARRRAAAAVERTRFEVGTAAADAFLTLLAARQTAVAAEAGVERSRVLFEIVDSLARAELRPGADASRARAELAIAGNQLIQARQAVAVAEAALAQFIGGPVSAQPGPLLGPPPDMPPPAAAPEAHPRLSEQNAAIEQVRAGRRALDRSYYPRFNLQAVTYGRGTGAMTTGELLGGAGGLGPNIFNWGLGLTVTFPALEFPALRARKDVERSRERSEAARYEQVRRELASELEIAKAQLEGARRVAQNTPVQLEAARATERQATARYRAGLGTLVEVADAQRLITQAEIDDSLARLGVWRGMLRVAAAQGDLDPFLRQAER